MMLHYQSVLRHVCRLQSATSLSALLEVTRDAVEEVAGYRHTWLAVFGEAPAGFFRIAAIAGGIAPQVLAECPLIPVAGDAMVLEILASRDMVVVANAQLDPRTNKDIVRRVGNRSIVNVPLPITGGLIGALGMGTFRDEGLKTPTAEEKEALTILALQLAGALERVKLLEDKEQREGERRQVEAHLQALQRLETMAILAAGVAHDLNNHLTVIQGVGELLARRARPVVDESLVDLLAAAEQSTEIVRQLLAIGRTGAAARRVVKPGEWVAATTRLVRPAIPRTIKLEQDLGEVGTVHGDATQLEQVLANLLINARDALVDHGTIRMVVDEQEFDPATASRISGGRAGRFVRLRVIDDGPGMAPEVLSRAFDPFFTTKPLGRGTGLGLAVVARVIAQHEGFLGCESGPGKGTTFSLFLPVAQSPRLNS